MLTNEEYCPTRDVFQARLDRFIVALEKDARFQDTSSLLGAVMGEIGNNAFDHNLGNWKDTPGVYFTHDLMLFYSGQALYSIADNQDHQETKNDKLDGVVAVLHF